MSAFLPFASPHGESKIREEILSSPASSTSAAVFSEHKTAALRELKGKLCNVPHDEKAALVHVQRVQPDLVNDEHLLRFLRVEEFNVDLTLKRLLTYWEERYKVFGPDKFALPMTLNGAMKDSIDVLRMGFHHLLPVLDEAGRAIIYHDSSPFKIHPHPPPSEHRIRALWYLMHVALEMTGVAEKGYASLFNSREMSVINFDPKWAVALGRSGRIFPIRWKVSHVCNSSRMFPFLANSIKALLSIEQRESCIFHSGSDSMILESLAKYHLPPHCVPKNLGGTLDLLIEEFIQVRLMIEEVVNAKNQGDSGNLKSPNEEFVHPILSGEHMVPEKRGLSDEPASSPKPTSESTKSSLAVENVLANEQQKNISHQKRKGDGSSPVPAKKRSHPGRYGDPRMRRAVEAKTQEPRVSLLDALIVGGFVFPGLDDPGVKVSTVLDSDGVSLYQRRNQLLRRIRMLKDKTR